MADRAPVHHGQAPSEQEGRADPARPARARRRSAAPQTLEVVRKPVNTLAIVPKSARITSLARKSYNVLLYEAQEQGLDKDVYRIPLERVLRGVDFDSNDHELIKKHLRSMVSTTVEWQSPTSGEGTSWNVSGLLAHAKLTKQAGQVWVEWSYSVSIKQEMLDPSVFARLKLEIVSQLRSHAGIALYEICTRYKDVGRTSRQQWRWWQPVLSGQPESERTAKLEYRIFKRDTLKPAIAEVNTVTDLEVELLEHKEGRWISEIQFLIRPKKQSPLPLRQPPAPVDLSLVSKGRALSVPEGKLEELLEEFGEEAVRSGLEALDRRVATAFPQPLRDPYRYLRSLMPAEAAKVQQTAVAASDSARKHALELPSKRQAKWTEEWLRRRREAVIAEIRALSPQAQSQLVQELSQLMEERDAHPSIRKRLSTSGWNHPLVLHEVVKYYAAGAYGPTWDSPTTAQLLQIAAELGDQ